MRSDKLSSEAPQPQTRSELQAWIREHLHLATPARAIAARGDRSGLQPPRAALAGIQARGDSGALGGFADKTARVKRELLAKDATVSSISRYFEAARRRSHGQIAPRPEDEADELRPVHRAARVVSRARAARTLVRRRSGRHHRVQVVQRRARAFGRRPDHRTRRASAARAGALRRPDRPGAADDAIEGASCEIRRRRILFPDSRSRRYPQAYAIAERFREAVERYDWTLEDRRLAVQPVRVDVGVVCLWLGRVAERRFIARRLAADLIQRADKLMYEAKGERANHIYLVRANISNGALVEVTDDTETPLAGAHEQAE